MKTYTHLVFDIDGTLLNTEMAVLHSLQWALKRQGIELSLDQLRFALGIPGTDALKRFPSSSSGSGTARMGREIYRIS